MAFIEKRFESLNEDEKFRFVITHGAGGYMLYMHVCIMNEEIPTSMLSTENGAIKNYIANWVITLVMWNHKKSLGDCEI